MKKIKKKKSKMEEEGGSPHPENSGAVFDPLQNYISFTTFKGNGVTGQDLLNTAGYREALTKMITVGEYQYFSSIREASNLKDKTMPFFLPHTMVYFDELPVDLEEPVNHFCKRFKDENGEDDTVVLLRFYENLDGDYYPADVQIQDKRLQLYKPDEESEEE